MIDPDARALLALIEERGVPAVHTQSPQEARRFYRERRFFTQPPPPEVASVRDMQADGYPRGEIFSVGPIPFYAKTVGARISRVYYRYAKQL